MLGEVPEINKWEEIRDAQNGCTKVTRNSALYLHRTDRRIIYIDQTNSKSLKKS